MRNHQHPHLGFEPSKIGTHFLHSDAVMEMYLAVVPVYTITLISKRSSKAFLCYIWKQGNQFSYDVAKKMLTLIASNDSRHHTSWYGARLGGPLVTPLKRRYNKFN